MRILIIEDEPKTGNYLKQGLVEASFVVDLVRDGTDGLHRGLTETYDLIILDVMLPGIDGWAVLQGIRKTEKDTPILFLTAKNTEDDRVHGFETGGDDYLGKPFQVRELLTRVRAILRREAWYRNRTFGGRQKFGEVWVDFENFCGEGPQGPFTMGVKECMILKLLMERAGQVVSRQEIIDRVWGEDAEPTPRTVDNFIVRLRRVMEVDAHHPRWVHTLRSVGYQFDPEGKTRKGEE